MKTVKMQKQSTGQKKTFAQTVETKIGQKLLGLSKKEKRELEKLKHPKSGKGL